MVRDQDYARGAQYLIVPKPEKATSARVGYLVVEVPQSGLSTGSHVMRASARIAADLHSGEMVTACRALTTVWRCSIVLVSYTFITPHGYAPATVRYPSSFVL